MRPTHLPLEFRSHRQLLEFRPSAATPTHPPRVGYPWCAVYQTKLNLVSSRSGTFQPSFYPRPCPKPTHTAAIKRPSFGTRTKKTSPPPRIWAERNSEAKRNVVCGCRRRWSAQSLQCVDREHIPGIERAPLPIVTSRRHGTVGCCLPLYSIRPCYRSVTCGHQGRGVMRDVCRDFIFMPLPLVCSSSSHLMSPKSDMPLSGTTVASSPPRLVSRDDVGLLVPEVPSPNLPPNRRQQSPLSAATF